MELGVASKVEFRGHRSQVPPISLAVSAEVIES
jgi:hypothetical protein